MRFINSENPKNDTPASPPLPSLTQVIFFAVAGVLNLFSTQLHQH